MRERWWAVMGWVYICVFIAGARRIGIWGFQARKTLLCILVICREGSKVQEGYHKVR